MVELSSWGLFPKIEAEVAKPATQAELEAYCKKTASFIPRGNGRSYGDSALNQHVLSSAKLKKFLEFDTGTGVINCQAGVLLSEILEVVVPKGFFLPVTPGTKFVSLGGAIASNVHGKNHHKEGSIGSFVQEMTVMDSNGQTFTCSTTNNLSLFTQTLGGMGLEGIIISAKLRLKRIESAFIRSISIKADSIYDLFNLFEEYKDTTYSVAWIDCQSTGKNLGRSVLMLGEHAKLSELSESSLKNPLSIHFNGNMNIPFFFPSGLLNSLTVRAFNFLYYHKQGKKVLKKVVHYDAFFYPLDKILNWNRIYGTTGFLQYQFVIPFELGKEGMIKILNKIASSGHASFLAVLKTFGNSEAFCSPLAFPSPGYTLALDFPISPSIFELLDQLDEIVISYGGKIYLTKDARLTYLNFTKMYPDYTKQNGKFSSLQSKRFKL